MTETTLGQGSVAGAEVVEATAVTLVREPRQERSRRTLKRILDAGLYLLEHEGPEALTVTALTKRARTSVGSFYARFRGKDDLLRYLGERALNEALEVWAQLRKGLQAGGALRGSVADVVQRLGWLYLEGAGRSLVLLDGIEDPSPSRRRRLEDSIARDLRGLEIASDVRSDLATRVVTGILQDAVVRSLRDSFAEEGGTQYPEAPVLISELVELLVGYLGGEVRAPVLPEGLRPASALAEAAVSLEERELDEPAPVPSEPETTDEPDAPSHEIATEVLIDAALADEPPASPSPGTEETPTEPVEEAAPPEEVVEAGVTPDPDPVDETESQPAPESEPTPEPDPDPFDVWG